MAAPIPPATKTSHGRPLTSPRTVELLLLRHGIAEERDPAGDDRHRALTGRGQRRTRAVLERLQALGFGADACLSSPLRRAQQTAELALAVGLVPSLTLTPQLEPDGDPLPALASWLRELLPEGDRPGQGRPPRLLLVGHEPDLSDLACRLLGLESGRLALRKAGLGLLELMVDPTADVEALVGKGRLQLLLSPRVLVG